MKDKKALKAKNTIKKYCNEHDGCVGCVFETSTDKCALMKMYPWGWGTNNEIRKDCKYDKRNNAGNNI